MSDLESQQFPPTSTGIRWVVLGLIAFASASAYLTRHCISAANTAIQDELGFDDAEMGYILAAFGVGYMLFQVPGGWLGTRYGTRFAFAFLSTCWSLCSIWAAMSSSMLMLLVSRFTLGVFQAGMAPNSAKILKDWLPVPVRGMSSAFVFASMSLGGAFTLWLTGLLLSLETSWRSIFAAYSLVGILWAMFFYWFFRTSPAEHTGVNEAELKIIQQTDIDEQQDDAVDEIAQPNMPADPVQNTPGDLAIQLISHPGIWGISLQCFFRTAAYTFFVTWFFAFLEYAYEIKKAEAGLLSSLPLIGVVIGSLLGGVTIDLLLRMTGSKWISRTGLAFVSLSLCGLLTLASSLTSTAAEFSLVIALGIFFAGIGGPAMWSASIDLGGKQTAVVMGVMNSFGSLGGVILPMVVGNWIKEIRETDGDWNQIIYLVSALYFTAAISWLLVNPNREVS